MLSIEISKIYIYIYIISS